MSRLKPPKEGLPIVIFDKSSCSTEIYEQYFKKIFEGKSFIFLGEIKQCPGHCVLVDLKTGEILTMYHTMNFKEKPEDEC